VENSVLLNFAIEIGFNVFISFQAGLFTIFIPYDIFNCVTVIRCKSWLRPRERELESAACIVVI
jgi:hypothetical protein